MNAERRRLLPFVKLKQAFDALRQAVSWRKSLDLVGLIVYVLLYTIWRNLSKSCFCATGCSGGNIVRAGGRVSALLLDPRISG